MSKDLEQFKDSICHECTLRATAHCVDCPNRPKWMRIEGVPMPKAEPIVEVREGFGVVDLRDGCGASWEMMGDLAKIFSAEECDE